MMAAVMMDGIVAAIVAADEVIVTLTASANELIETTIMVAMEVTDGGTIRLPVAH
jgi:hypothetical protein